MSFLSSLFIVLQIASGAVIVRFVDPLRRLTRLERGVASMVLGLAGSTFLLFLLLLITRSWAITVPLLWAVMVGVVAAMAWHSRGALLRPYSRSDWKSPRVSTMVTAMILAGFIALYIGTLSKTFSVDLDGYPKSASLSWGDSAYHLDIIGRLSQDPFSPEHPVLSGERLRYPFLINLASALYIKLGASLLVAWHAPLVLFGAALILGLYAWGRRIIQSNALAILLILFVFLGAGTGFTKFYNDATIAWDRGGAREIQKTFLNPPRDYTNKQEGTEKIQWIVPLISFFTHQRPFVAGAALGVLMLIGLFTYGGTVHLWRWSALVGFVPFWHGHTFIALVLIAGAWTLASLRAWLHAAGVGAIIALPQLLYLAPQETRNAATPFFQTIKGWMIDENALAFWTRNFGVLFWAWVLIIVIVLWRWRKKRTDIVRSLVVVSLILFFVPNVIQFQPWVFDNNKILLYWWVVAATLVLVGARVLLARMRRHVRALGILSLTLFVVVAIFSGTLDVLRRWHEGTPFGYYTAADIAVAQWIRSNTEPSDRFLTASVADQFIPMLTGRPIYLGYEGWLWSQGYRRVVDAHRTHAARVMIAGDLTGLCADGVDYVFWDQKIAGAYPGGDYTFVRARAVPVFTEDGGLARQILKLQCS